MAPPRWARPSASWCALLLLGGCHQRRCCCLFQPLPAFPPTPTVCHPTPITLQQVRNKDQKSQDYSEMEQAYRPSHADATYDFKYGIRAVSLLRACVCWLLLSSLCASHPSAQQLSHTV